MLNPSYLFHIEDERRLDCNIQWVSSSVSPTIPTILTTRRSMPLSASKRTKRMLSQKERIERKRSVRRYCPKITSATQ